MFCGFLRSFACLWTLNADAEADVWKVSITTGIFEPLGTNEINDEDAGNTNNNANDKEEKENMDYVSQKKRSLKYQMAPWAPVGQLFIVIYGDRGKTGLLPLTSDQPSDKEKFLPGHVDTFKVAFVNISHTQTRGSFNWL